MKKKESQHRLGFLNAQWWPVDDANKSYVRRILSRYPVFCSLSATTEDEKIYHYTSVEALLNIINERGFWVSHYAYMNDASEFHHGLNICSDVLKRLANKQRYRDFKEILLGARELITAEPEPEYFVACFTKEADSLEQWRAYCPNGGVNIELSNKFGGGLGGGPGLLFHKAVYKRIEKYQFILLKIRIYFNEFINDLKFYKGELSEDHKEEYVKHISEDIKFRIPTFKNSAFKSENEIRLIIPYETAKRDFKIYNRVRNGKIVPYLKTSDYLKDVSPLSISSVIVGPQAEEKLVARSIAQYFRNNGYENTPVEFSAVPYRTT